MIKYIKTGVLAVFIAVCASDTFFTSDALAEDMLGAALKYQPDILRAYDLAPKDVLSDVKTQLYAQRAERGISASQAKSIAMSYVSGARFVNIQMVDSVTYRVRLQKNDRIIDVYVDARTGAVN